MNTKRITLSANDKKTLVGNFATMLAAGISILEAVDSLLEDAKGNQKKVLEVLRDDLGDRLPPMEASRLLEIETDARRNGERLLFVPTFYAAGEKASGRG